MKGQLCPGSQEVKNEKNDRKILSGVFVFLLFSVLFLGSGYSLGAAAELPKSVTLIAGRLGSSNYAFATGVTTLVTKTTGIKAVPGRHVRKEPNSSASERGGVYLLQQRLGLPWGSWSGGI